MQPLRTKKKSRNLSLQKNHATSLDKKKHTQPFGTKTRKIKQPLGTKKNTEKPLRTKKNHATSWGGKPHKKKSHNLLKQNKKSCNLLRQPIRKIRKLEEVGKWIT